MGLVERVPGWPQVVRSPMVPARHAASGRTPGRKAYGLGEVGQTGLLLLHRSLEVEAWVLRLGVLWGCFGVRRVSLGVHWGAFQSLPQQTVQVRQVPACSENDAAPGRRCCHRLHILPTKVFVKAHRNKINQPGGPRCCLGEARLTRLSQQSVS